MPPSPNNPIRLVLTPGDPEGIGAEVTAKALHRLSGLGTRIQVICISAKGPFKKKRHQLPRSCSFLAAPEDLSPGGQSAWSIVEAVRLITSGEAHALVTGPISKARIQAAGYPYSGHTEFLARLSSPASNKPHDVTMMMANPELRVSLVTTHLPLHKVSASITPENIIRACNQTLSSLTRFWGIRKPRIAVLGLNPHAGESGHLGNEETTIIQPTIDILQETWGKTAKLDGPFPADTWFALRRNHTGPKKYDAVVAMYHDQGLIPAKLLDFKNTVNVTLGLPFIRTSVDHGVAFDIANQGIADESSMYAALCLAAQLSKGKKQ